MNPTPYIAILAFALGMSGIVMLFPWDHRALYVLYTLLFCLAFGGIAAVRRKASKQTGLLSYAIISFLIGASLHTFSTSPTVRAMLSGIEFINLAVFALLILLGVKGYSFFKTHTKREGLQTILLLLLTTFIVVQWGISWTYQFPEQNGPYTVGTTSDFVSDIAREEVFTKNPLDHRSLMLQYSYPGIYRAGAKRLAFKNLRRIQTNSYIDLSLAGHDKLPLILYSAGAGGSRFDNTSQIEHLASHGYFVVAIDHSYLNDVDYPNGSRLKAYTMDTLRAGIGSDAYREAVVHRTRVLDLQSVLDHLAFHNLDTTSKWFQRFDMEKVGVFGWSIGGSAAVEVCVKDTRFKAGVNLDGWGWMKLDTTTPSFQGPFMYIHSDISSLTKRDLFLTGMNLQEVKQMDKRQSQREQLLFQHSSHRGFSLEIQGAFHSNMRDHGLIGISRLGPIDAETCNRLVSTSMLTFFDRYLLNKNGPSLTESLQNAPQVSFRWK